MLFDFLVALLSMYFDIFFCFGVLNEGAQLFKDTVVVVHGDFLELTFKLVFSDGVLSIIRVVQNFLLPDLHDGPLDDPSIGEHLDLLNFIALNVLVSLRVQ